MSISSFLRYCSAWFVLCMHLPQHDQSDNQAYMSESWNIALQSSLAS